MGALSSEEASTGAEPTSDDVDTRERIVRAALEVFVEKGYGGTRVQDIAARAHLTPGALYVHFPNRSRLLAEAIVVEGRRLIGGLADDLARIEPGDDRVARLMTDLLISESSTIDRLMVEAFALAARDPEARAQLDRTLERLHEMVAGRVRVAIATGAASRRLSVDALTTFFTTWIMGIIVDRAIGRPRPDERDMLEVVRTLLNGLAEPTHRLPTAERSDH